MPAPQLDQGGYVAAREEHVSGRRPTFAVPGPGAGAESPGYSSCLRNSIEETNLDDWNGLRLGDGDVFMDPRFIAAVERSMVSEARCWTLIVYDEQGRPAAIACISLMRTDGAVLARGLALRAIHALRRVRRNFFYFRVLFLGLPVSASQSHLRIRPGADPERVLAAIESALADLARTHRAHAVVFKEFAADEALALTGLKNHGYFRAESLPLNCLDVHYRDFEDYCESRGARARHNLRRTVRRFADAGLRIVQVTGAEGADKLYTDDVHRLYEAVWDRADSKLEKLPAEFFRQVARGLGEQAVFSFAYHGERVVGFGCSLVALPDFHMLFVGLDYSVNRESELYFNLCYRELDFAMRHGARTILTGQTADAFKSRLRCYHRPLCFFARLRGPIGLLLRPFSRLLFPPPNPATESSAAAAL